MCKIAINILEQVSCRYIFLILLHRYPGVKLLDHSVDLFNFYKKCQIAFHSSCASLYSHEQYVTVPVSPQPC